MGKALLEEEGRQADRFRIRVLQDRSGIVEVILISKSAFQTNQDIAKVHV